MKYTTDTAPGNEALFITYDKHILNFHQRVEIHIRMRITIIIHTT
jgi:hypothetical protein